MPVSLPQIVRHLRELIAALDRRVPRPERLQEASIAKDAAELKVAALDRIAELETPASQPRSVDAPK